MTRNSRCKIHGIGKVLHTNRECGILSNICRLCVEYAFHIVATFVPHVCIMFAACYMIFISLSHVSYIKVWNNAFVYVPQMCRICVKAVSKMYRICVSHFCNRSAIFWQIPSKSCSQYQSDLTKLPCAACMMDAILSLHLFDRCKKNKQATIIRSWHGTCEIAWINQRPYKTNEKTNDTSITKHDIIYQT